MKAYNRKDTRYRYNFLKLSRRRLRKLRLIIFAFIIILLAVFLYILIADVQTSAAISNTANTSNTKCNIKNASV